MIFVSKIVIWNKMNMTSSPPQTIDPCLCFGLRNKPKNCLIGYTQFISRKNDSFLSIVLSWYALLSYKKYIKTSLSTSFDIYSLLNLIVLGIWYNLVNKIPRNQFFAFTNKKRMNRWCFGPILILWCYPFTKYNFSKTYNFYY